MPGVGVIFILTTNWKGVYVPTYSGIVTFVFLKESVLMFPPKYFTSTKHLIDWRTAIYHRHSPEQMTLISSEFENRCYQLSLAFKLNRLLSLGKSCKNINKHRKLRGNVHKKCWQTIYSALIVLPSLDDQSKRLESCQPIAVTSFC